MLVYSIRESFILPFLLSLETCNLLLACFYFYVVLFSLPISYQNLQKGSYRVFSYPFVGLHEDILRKANCTFDGDYHP